VDRKAGYQEKKEEQLSSCFKGGREGNESRGQKTDKRLHWPRGWEGKGGRREMALCISVGREKNVAQKTSKEKEGCRGKPPQGTNQFRGRECNAPPYSQQTRSVECKVKRYHMRTLNRDGKNR